MARCQNGHENPEGQRFCGECGLPLAGATAEAETLATPTSSASDAELTSDRSTPARAGEAASERSPARRWLPIGIVAGVVVALVLIGVLVLGAGGNGGAGHTLRGDFVVFGDCGTGGYDDVYQGQQVIVRDRDGKTLAKGELGPEEGDCSFPFTVRDIPDAEFYGVEISHRGELTYTKEELEDLDWSVFLSLGEPGDDL